jgi:8-oxo-dGTP diphosphatase
MQVIVVAAILQNSQGRVLLQQRTSGPDVPFAGQWTLPGGKVEEEETPGEAIKRELLEEIEAETPLDLWKTYERPGPSSITIVQHVYVGQLDTPASSLAMNEGQALAYFAPDKIGELPIAYGFDILLAEYFYR